jgi:hypothetical protein
MQRFFLKYFAVIKPQTDRHHLHYMATSHINQQLRCFWLWHGANYRIKTRIFKNWLRALLGHDI